MDTTPLADGWMMAPAEAAHGDLHDAGYAPQGWLPVRVPTTVQAALVAADRAPSPWRDRQAQALADVEERTWWFRTTFDLPNEPADGYEVVLEGVSLFATIWLNGSPVGFMQNAHYPGRFDVTAHVRPGATNVLAIECGLDLKDMRRRVRPDIRSTGEAVRPYMRMPQMCFGWDFAPKIVLVGPWRPVYLVRHRGATIEDAWVATESVGSPSARADASITVAADVRTWSAPSTRLRLAIREDADAPPVWRDEVPVPASGAVRVPVRLANARLWYPQPAGEPFRYALAAELVGPDGVVLDRTTTRFGIRTIELAQDGRFTFSVNGVDVFAKGANWVPSNSLTLEVGPDEYRHLLELARDANFNMLRVWGGGFYESEVFYDLCDEFGIMIWQDFMYACAMYPDDEPAFMESATREARSVAERLRRHPCLALWCGNNECQEAWVLGDWPNFAPRHLGERLYDHVLPDTVRAVTPGVPYWPGSPYGGPTTRSREIGDFHDWYSLPNWRTYDANAPRFSSEYGFRAVPARETVDAMLSPEVQWDRNGPQHNAWQFHHGWCGWMQAVLPEFGGPTTLDEYIMLTQEMQATLMRYAIEVYRRRMFATSGSLLWMYNEPWPSVSFGIVDFFGRQKASYFWARAAYAPVMGMFYAKGGPGNGGEITYWGINDLPAEQEARVRLRRFDHAGALLGEATIAARLAANASTCIAEALPADLQIADPTREFVCGELQLGAAELVAAGAAHGVGVATSQHVFHHALRRDWALVQTTVDATAERIDAGRVRVRLVAPTYVHFASASVEDSHARYSDNFVDLLPNEPRTVDILTCSKGRITIRSANGGARTISSP